MFMQFVVVGKISDKHKTVCSQIYTFLNFASFFAYLFFNIMIFRNQFTVLLSSLSKKLKIKSVVFLSILFSKKILIAEKSLFSL